MDFLAGFIGQKSVQDHLAQSMPGGMAAQAPQISE